MTSLPAPNTGKKSLRVQGMPPENDGLDTPSRGKRTIPDDVLAAGHAGEGGAVVPVDKPPTVYSKKSKKSSVSTIRRRKLALDLQAAEDLAALEAEREALKLAAIERKENLLRKKLEFKQAEIEEGEESDDSQALEDLDDIPDTRDPVAVVENWMKNNNHPATPHYSVPPDNVNDKLEKLLARQTIPKDLPSFSGDPKEWQLFYCQYKNSTDVCGLTDTENALRLAKCLQGKARETVAAMLGIPANVSLVMETLQLTFGRPNKIIASMIEQVRAVRPMPNFEVDAFITFSNLVQSLVTTMHSLNTTNHLSNPQLLEELLAKVPVNIQLDWCKKLRTDSTAGLAEFASFLRETAAAAALMPVAMSAPQDNYRRTGGPADRRQGNGFNSRHPRGGCPQCNQFGHSLDHCPEFLKLSHDDKWRFASEKHLCFRCLQSGHRTATCMSPNGCGKCQSNHHSLLHQDKPTHMVGHVVEYKPSVLLRILPVRIYGPTSHVDIFALLDSGSTVTLIDEKVADLVGLTGPKEPLCLQWTNDQSQCEEDSRAVQFRISSVYENSRVLDISRARTVKNMSLPTQSVEFGAMCKTWPYLRGAVFNSYDCVQPQILIGQDNVLLTLGRLSLHGKTGEPVATKTWLGWTVHGSSLVSGQPEALLSHHECEHVVEDDELKTMIKNSFSTEFFGVNVPRQSLRSKADDRAFTIMSETTTRIGDRFQTGLLWKSDGVALPESKKMALKRLYCVERKMDKDAKFAEKYAQNLEAYMLKGYAKKLTAEDIKAVTLRTWYIPHFPVTNPNKPDKLRIVFDCAAKSNGTSLNDALMSGPDLYNSIPAIIMRFRQGRIAFTGDIAEMFPQIKILETDQASQRFLWRGSRRDGPPDEYVMTSMIFGAACSPASAIFTKDLNAMQFVEEFPEAVNVIKSNMYMDDVLASRDSEPVALKVIQDIIEIHKRGGFNIRNWTCNSKSVLTQIPSDMRAKGWTSLDMSSELPTERVLGMWWNPETDCFTYKLNFHKVNPDVLSGLKLPTKRDVLRVTMSIFDPIGLVSHFVIKARILFQQIWRSGIHWDDTIPESLQSVWNTWLTELKNITTVSVPRWYFRNCNGAPSVQLHIFVDSSEVAFAAVAYLRIHSNAGTQVSIVCGRIRVAPLKPLTIPRLELQAAVMGVRLASTIKQEVEFSVESTHFWSDSQTVLCWLRSEARRFKQFVANRVGEILESSEVEQWRWVSTDVNPADLATRAVKSVDFRPSSTWFNGPEFLWKDEKEWPLDVTVPEVSEDDEEVRTDFVLITNEKLVRPAPNVDILTRMYKLLRSTAYMLRFIKNCRLKTRHSPDVDCDEFYDARKYWVKKVQEEEFPQELAFLRDGKTVPRSSRLFTLSPFLDVDGIIRMQGRTVASNCLSDESKFPIILGPNHKFVHLLIYEHHVLAHHQGLETVLNNLRQWYWIIKIRATVKTVTRCCQWCMNHKVRPHIPEMAPLPEARVNACVRPFTRTGMDFFGPMMVTIGKKQEKRYGLLFTCLNVRAVHIEVTPSLSTDSTLMAIRRFASRRGYPREIWSDNGTSFTGAERELQELLALQDKARLQSEVLRHGTDWRHIPPLSPHMGGSWERLIRSVKVALNATMKEHIPKEETLITLLTEVEFIINSRPLTHVSVDPKDPECLTPNHFLIMGDSVLPSWSCNDEFHVRMQWRRVQQRADVFWRRWVKEYLPTLTRRTGAHDKFPNLKVGDVVVIADPNSPRSSWPLGVVDKTFPGKDNVVRVAEVRTSQGIYRRPTRLLAKLDVLDNKGN